MSAMLLCLVIAVHDGDTLTASCGGDQVKVRLAAIDAPELKQAYGDRAKRALMTLCLREQASIEPTKRDRYGRTVAEVECKGKDAQREMVSTGMAMVYDQYASGRADLYRLQGEAKAAKRGLWADSAPTPPWEFRRARRAR